MSRVCRLHLFAAAVLALGPAVVLADLIFLKDGHVLQGKVRRETTAEFDPVSRDMTMIPRGFFLLDDGPRRMVFSPTQVRIAEKLIAPAEERVVRTKIEYILQPRRMFPILGVVETTPWDLKTWKREYYFRTPLAARVGVRQALAEITPYYARVDAVTKFKWSCAYLTREWDPDEILKLLKANPAFEETDKLKPGEIVARRMKLCDFLVQAGWFDQAEQELNRLVKDMPDQKERVAGARVTIDKLRARELWEQTKNWYQAARYDAVRKRLATFPNRNVPERIQSDIREMKTWLNRHAELVDEASKALDDVCRGLTTARGRALASAVAVIRNELHPATVDRLEAFLGQYREAERRRERKVKQILSEDDLLSLAITGWLLGSPSAEARPEGAIALWKTRQLVLAYLQENDADERTKLLTEYEKTITPRIELDEIAQMVDFLPPAIPSRERSTNAVECTTGSARNPVTYHLKLPPEYSHSRPYPVLIALHNVGEKPTAMLERFEKLAADHGYILAAPRWDRGINDHYGYTEREHDTVLLTLRDLRRRFQVDSDRVFLSGFSEGGKMAFDVGLAHPDEFAGILPICAGPGFYPQRCWRNAQILPIYTVNGTWAGNSQAALREQFTHWTMRGYPSLWVEYKGRGTEWFSAEVPAMFDWMRHQVRAFPMHQLGTDGGGTSFGNEFCTLRPGDNRFYWLTTSQIHPRYQMNPERPAGFAQPATMTARIDPGTNEIVLKAVGLGQISVWIGRNSKGHYMLDLEKPVSLRLGFRGVFNGRKIAPSLGVMLEDLYQRVDRKHLFVARIDVTIR